MNKIELTKANEDEKLLYNERIEDWVHIHLEKEAGSYSCKRELNAGSPAAAINALGLLIMDLAKDLEVPVVHVMSILAVVLMGPGEEEQTDGKADV